MLSAYNYKVEVAVGAKPAELKQYLSVADTGAAQPDTGGLHSAGNTRECESRPTHS